MIIPIHKKGPSTFAANFRPISLVSSISKLMERVIVSKITIFLTARNLISPAQFGFQARSSTVIQLIDSHNGWLSSQNIYRPMTQLTLYFWTTLKRSTGSVTRN